MKKSDFTFYQYQSKPKISVYRVMLYNSLLRFMAKDMEMSKCTRLLIEHFQSGKAYLIFQGA